MSRAECLIGKALAVPLAVVLTTAISGCGSDRRPAETYASVSELAAHLDLGSGLSCNGTPGIPANPKNKLSRFDGLSEAGVCVDGARSLMLLVFDDAVQRRRFTASDAWLSFERMFTCVRDGDTFHGIEGGNWLVSNGGDPANPTAPIPARDEIVSALSGTLVTSKPAVGETGVCLRASSTPTSA